jgi:altronate dehydratase
MSRWEELALRLHEDDDVVVAIRPIAAGTEVKFPNDNATTSTAIPFCHKIAIRDREPGDAVRKFGQIIGFATKEIRVGDHVHTHNLECGAYSRDDIHPTAEVPSPPRSDRRTFDGHLRSDGRVGTRNYLAVIGTVNCSAAVVRRIAGRFANLAEFPNVDGVFAVAHQTGCGMSASGLDLFAANAFRHRPTRQRFRLPPRRTRLRSQSSRSIDHAGTIGSGRSAVADDRRHSRLRRHRCDDRCRRGMGSQNAASR